MKSKLVNTPHITLHIQLTLLMSWCTKTIRFQFFSETEQNDQGVRSARTGHSRPDCRPPAFTVSALLSS